MKSLNRSFCSTTELPRSRTFSAVKFDSLHPTYLNQSIHRSPAIIPSNSPNFLQLHPTSPLHHLITMLVRTTLVCSPRYLAIYIGFYCELFSLSLYRVLSRVLCRVLSRSLSSRCGRCTSRSDYTKLSDWSEMDD